MCIKILLKELDQKNKQINELKYLLKNHHMHINRKFQKPSINKKRHHLYDDNNRQNDEEYEQIIKHIPIDNI
eukprot:UN04061